jgi:hypothetical protein
VSTDTQTTRGNDQDWPVIPEITNREYTDVLACYAQTMWYVQRFEHTLKLLLFISKWADRSSCTLSKSDFDALFEQTIHKSTLKNLLDGLRSWFVKHDMHPMPKVAETFMVEKLVPLRNSLAHNYLYEHARLFTNGDARQAVKAELNIYAQIFSLMTTPWEKLLDIAIANSVFRKLRSKKSLVYNLRSLLICLIGHISTH